MKHYLDEQADAAEEREARERTVFSLHQLHLDVARLAAEDAQIVDARKALYFRYREGRASGDPVSASRLAQVAAELWPC